ncbi:nephrin-like [Strongylocentrotus purpuratus]|uniref:Ig-like domain-containing protein n=1 Tax=Strongylocentrotus purpuratus TaxID=7668 RepID=A0A7M7NC28_STRPU|nr:nephrin-like [Strongylocentrotus purpuratus]
MHLWCYASLGDFLDLRVAKLMVYSPPDDVRITKSEDLQDGIKINVGCRASNGYPAPLIHWYIGSRNVTHDSSINTSHDEANRYDAESTLTLIPNRIYHGKRLLCQAVQPTKPSKRLMNDSMVLAISSAPRLLSITDVRSVDGYKNGASVSITYGRTHNLICSAQGARPPAELEWDVPEEVRFRLEDQYNAVDGEAYTSQRVISVTPSKEDEGKMIRCMAFHRELDSGLQLFIRLDVQVSPINLRITASDPMTIDEAGTRSAIVFEASAKSFTCTSVGSRPSAVISWIIGSDADLGIMTSTSTNNVADPALRDTSNLQLIPKRRHHSQFLRCVANAGMNEHQTEVRVIVHDSPALVDYSVRRVSSGQHSVDAVLTCTSDSRPRALIIWFLNGTELNGTRHYILHNPSQEDTLRESRSTLLVHRRSKPNDTIYSLLCLAACNP